MTERDIFVAALQKEDPAERRAYLDDACAAQPDLRRQVEDLLRLHEGAGSFLEKPAAELATTRPSQETAEQAPPPEAPGAVIGPYKLVEQIGEGGMGTVWMAQQTEPVKRLVAVKLIKAGMDSAQVIARFEAERQALALMDHPNIARVLDAGTTTGGLGGVSPGRPYFVMDLVKGVPITRYCDVHHLTPRQRLELFIPVCRAVQHAHQKGVIHRDLKPSNVLVAPYDGKPVPKVIDFGVAKAAGQPLTDKTLVTGFGAIVGTLEYMSPEQAEVNQLDVDTRSDIYSLGVLLYELLTGSPPFARKDLESAGLLETLRVIREQEPTRPSKKLSTAEGLPTLAANRGTEPAKLTRLVRGELDWIVMKALEKDRSRRYETAGAFAADVQRYLDDQPVQACPPSAWYRFRKFARRNKAVLVTGLAVAAAILVSVAGLAASTVMIAQEQRETKKALNAEIEANDKLGKALDRESDLLYLHRTALAHRLWLGGNPERAGQLLDECPPDRRRWEWFYLDRALHSEVFAYKAEGKPFRAVALSPDGRLLAAANVEDGVYVWDVASGREVPHLRKRGLRVTDVAFSPDGARLAAASGHGAPVTQLTAWESATGKEVLTIRAGQGEITRAAYSPDGKRLVTRDTRGTTPKVWDAESGQELSTPSGQWPDGIRLFDARIGVAVHTFLGPDALVEAVAFSPDGKYLASAGLDRTVKVWDLAARKLLVTCWGHTGVVQCVAFSPDGLYVASGSWDHTVKVWEAATGQEVGTYRGHMDRVTGVAFGPDGRRLASAGEDGVVKVWDATTCHATRAFRTPPGGAACLAFSPDSRRLAVGMLGSAVPQLSWSGVRVWDTRTGQPLLDPDGHPRWVEGVAFSPDGVLLASASNDGTVRVWDTVNRKEVRTFGGFGGERVHCVAFSPTGRHLAASGVRAAVKLWDLATGEELLGVAGAGNEHTRVAFNPDGTRLAWGGRTVTVWDLATKKDVLTLRGTPNGVTSLAFSPDGRRLASAGWPDHTIRVWDLTTGAEALTLRGHSGTVRGVSFSPDGTRLASASDDTTVRLWDLAGGQEALELRDHDQVVTCVAFSPDGWLLASAGLDQKILIRDATPRTQFASPRTAGTELARER